MITAFLTLRPGEAGRTREEHRRASLPPTALALLLAITWGASSDAATREESARLREQFEAAIRAMSQPVQPRVKSLSTLQGKLTAEDGRKVASLLLELSGDEMLGTALALRSCGAGEQAREVMMGIVKDPASQFPQWCPAMFYCDWYGFGNRTRVRHGINVEQELESAMCARLQTKTRDELLALLRQRELWLRSRSWQRSARVGWALCSAVTHEDAEVREAAVIALASMEERGLCIRTDEIRALVGIVVGGGAEAALGASRLLHRLLGIGPKGGDLATARKHWAEWQTAHAETFTLRGHALGRAAQPNRLTREEKSLVCSQIFMDSLATDAAEKARVFNLLVESFAADRSPILEGRGCWLGCLTVLAGLTGSEELERRTVATLVEQAPLGDLHSRLTALQAMQTAFMAMPRQCLQGSTLRRFLEDVLDSEQATMDERVMAACSLSTPARADRRLMDRILRLTTLVGQPAKHPLQYFKPDGALWHVSRALSAVLGKPLPSDPAQWALAFRGWRPMTHKELARSLYRDMSKSLPPGYQIPAQGEEAADP